MRKRIFSLLLAVVLWVTALFAMPQIQETTAYNQTLTNGTWDSSYHALSEDVGTKEEPGYIGLNTYTLTQGENEYSMPDKWTVVTFNDCEALTNADGITTYFDRTGGNYGVSYETNGTIGAFQNLGTNDGGSNCYVTKLASGNGGANVVAGITNGYQNFDITPYQYFRVQIFTQNMIFVPTAQDSQKYAQLQIHLTNGEKHGYDITDEFLDGSKAHDILWDVSNINGTVKEIQVHLSSVRRNTSDTARFALDNVRFIKNATHTDVYSYTPSKEIYRFHDCDTHTGVQVVSKSGYNNYTKYLNYTNQSGSIVDGAGSVVFGPNGAGNGQGYGVTDWYQIAFQNSTGVVPSEYQYMRFYAYFGDKYPVNSMSLKIRFGTETAYNENKLATTYEGVTVSNYKLNQGWYMFTVNIQGIKDRVKNISIEFGALNIANPGDNQDQAKLHIDYLHFFRYNYTPNTIYSYTAGHYKVLESFENYSSTSHNTSWQSYVVNYNVINYESGYKNSMDGWATGRNGTVQKSVNGTNEGMFSAAYPHQVTQGRYASIWRANINNNRDDCYVTYSFSETYNLSKFSHFSLDMSIRDLQKCAPRNKYDKNPGLTGNNERFMISLIDANGNSSNLVFYLKETHDYNNFISSPDHGVEGYPLYGFVPGYNERDHGPQYTPIGPMRLVINMGEVMDHTAGDFDVTQVSALRVSYIRGGGGRANTDYEYTSDDSRRVELFFDNFVAFTPDMDLTVKTTGMSEEDAGQRVIVNVNGNDGITNHVNIEYSSYPLTDEGIEIIKNLPLNSYWVSLEPWAWRYHEEKRRIADTTTMPRYNDTYIEGNQDRMLGYGEISRNKDYYLRPTVTFNLTRYHTRWLDGNGYATY